MPGPAKGERPTPSQLRPAHSQLSTGLPLAGGACRPSEGASPWPQSHNHRADLCSCHAHFPPFPTQPEGPPFRLRLDFPRPVMPRVARMVSFFLPGGVSSVGSYMRLGLWWSRRWAAHHLSQAPALPDGLSSHIQLIWVGVHCPSDHQKREESKCSFFSPLCPTGE